MRFMPRLSALISLLLSLAAAPALADVSATASDQDHVTSAEMIAFHEWRNCVLKVTHRQSRKLKDHDAVADLAISRCADREAEYRASLVALGQQYQLKDAEGFAQRNAGQVRKSMRDMAIKELK